MQRNATSSLGLDMDDFTYNYMLVSGEKSNRLQYVSDAATNDGVGGDILSGMSATNYVYDEIGQLISDPSEGIDSLQWRYGDKKLHRIVRDDASSSELEFVYNPFGQRVLKIEKARSGGAISYPGGDDWKYTYYTYDANGQVMAVYEFSGLLQVNQTVTVEEYNIYGSSREGQIKTQEVVWQNGEPNVSTSSIHQNTLGQRSYEVTNHLGNVLAVITDRNTVVDSTYEAVVVMTSDYYPFGMLMPERNWTSSGAETYRYAYNGMEQDNEVSGNGNSYTTEFRQYDPRLGRWKSLDPMNRLFPNMTPYNAFLNNPIMYVDRNGDIPWPLFNSWKNRNGRTVFRRLGRGKSGDHNGADMNMGAGRDDEGAPVRATHDGKVVAIKHYTDNDGGGNRIYIQSADGTVQTWYMHLESFGEGLKVGSKVREGQTIGYVGGSGRGYNGATKSMQDKGYPTLVEDEHGNNLEGQDIHLHYEIRVKNEKGIFAPIDPIVDGELIDVQVDLLSLPSNPVGSEVIYESAIIHEEVHIYAQSTSEPMPYREPIAPTVYPRAKHSPLMRPRLGPMRGDPQPLDSKENPLPQIDRGIGPLREDGSF